MPRAHLSALGSQQCSRASYASLALKHLDRRDDGLSPGDMVQHSHCPRNLIHGQLPVALAGTPHKDNTVGSGSTEGFPGSALGSTSLPPSGRQGSPRAVPARNCRQEPLSNDEAALCRAPRRLQQQPSSHPEIFAA